MYKIPQYPETSITTEGLLEGESLESKVARMLTNKEPINAEGVGLIYTERKKGVLAETNVRTDRWEIATDAMDKIEKSNKAKRENKFKIIEGGKDAESSSMADSMGG